LFALPGTKAQGPIPSATVKQRDLSKLPIQQRLFYLSGQRGMEWLQRANQPDGHFVNGMVPALRLPLEGDSYVRQAGAAFALARATKFFGDDRGSAIAKQALLTLLLETNVDPKEPTLRSLPGHQANPLVAAGTLVAGIHELPAPPADLLDQADQLANFVRKHIQADGSLNMAETSGESGAANAEAVQYYSGPAMYGVIRSQRLRPAPWKPEMIHKALAYYYPYWKQHKNVPMLAWHSAVYTEAYLLTKESSFADAVFDMNDWLCGMQYQPANTGRAAWIGSFPPWVDGKAASNLAPNIESAGSVASLVEACRLARATGDVQRYQRYRQAAESGLQFLTTLQYSEANTQHFADWYRPFLVGAFHASSQDGNVRLDYAEHSVSALVQYLHYVADLP